jgi:hypothetical protein
MSPQDYYAAAIALFGIILFAKFVTHARTATKWVRLKLDKKSSDKVWNGLHFFAVLAAIIGAASCFAVLGWAENNSPISVLGWNIKEEWFRDVVAIAAVISGIILAFDIGITHRGGGDPKSQPIENTDRTREAAETGGEE